MQQDVGFSKVCVYLEESKDSPQRPAMTQGGTRPQSGTPHFIQVSCVGGRTQALEPSLAISYGDNFSNKLEWEVRPGAEIGHSDMECRTPNSVKMLAPFELSLVLRAMQ